MKYLMLLVAGLAWLNTCAAPDTAWHSALALMTEQMNAVRYESYDYEATTTVPGDSTQRQSGSLYLNRPDTMLFHVIGPVTMVVSSDRFLRRDDAQKVIARSVFSNGNAEKRATLLGAFFNTGEAMALLESSFRDAKLLEMRSGPDSILIRLEVSDGMSYESRASISLNSRTHQLLEIRYDVVRHTDFKKPSPETDYRQTMRCFNYRWSRDLLAERRMQDSAVAIEKQVSANTYKVTQL